MAEELNNIVTEDKTKVLIGLRKKSDDSKVAVTAEDYPSYDKRSYAVDGIIIRDEENDIDILYSLEEVEAVFGEGAEDIPETDKRRKNYIPCSFSELNGEVCTERQLENHEDVHEEGCAICEAIKFGWLPSCGEMQLVKDNLEKFNVIATLIGSTLISDSEYWTSTQYSDDYVWSLDMNDGVFKFWRARGNTMKVRPVKSASEYQQTVD